MRIVCFEREAPHRAHRGATVARRGLRLHLPHRRVGPRTGTPQLGRVQLADLHVRMWDNGQLRHDYNTDDMEHRVPELVAWATARVALHSGDVIACGTNHEGLGPLQDGDTIVQTIDGIGSLRVTVRDPRARRWERGVYMGADSTDRAAVARHAASTQRGEVDQ